MTQSPTIGALAGALAKAQGRIHGAKKDSANPFFKSSYADLASVWDACKAPLADAEIAVIQYPASENATVRVTTMLAHSSGEYVTAEVTATAKDASPQSVGSTITYLRRYGLASMVGVYADDDDGEAAQGRTHQPPQRQTVAVKAQAPAAKVVAAVVAHQEKAPEKAPEKVGGPTKTAVLPAVQETFNRLLKEGCAAQAIFSVASRIHKRTISDLGQLSVDEMDRVAKGFLPVEEA